MPKRHTFIILIALFLLSSLVDFLQVSIDILAIDGIVEFWGRHSAFLDGLVVVLMMSGGIYVVVFEFGDIREKLVLAVFVFFYDGLDGEVFNC